MFVQYLKDKQDTLTYVHRKRKILILANHNRQIVLCVGCRPIHYRPIKGVQFEFAHFVSHFIRVRIFQNSLAFYICRGQKEYFSINSVRKKGRVELCQIFHQSNWCTDICKTPMSIFKPQFHHEVGLVQHRYFELFFSAWSIFSSYKRSAPNETDFNIFVHLL